MKFLAILKDSLREAIDCKVLYVMLGLSGLVILFVASMTFTPLPAEAMMRSLIEGDAADLVNIMRGQVSEEQEAGMPHGMRRASGPFQFAELRVLKGPADSPDSRYAVIVSMRLSSAERAAEIRRSPEKTIEELRKQFAVVEGLKLLHVPRIRVLPDHAGKETGTAVYFEVETEPTDSTRRLWPFEPSLFFGAVPLGGRMPLGVQLFVIASTVLSIGSWVTILVSVIITAFFIPNMLRKGTVDLLLVKPIHRWVILLFKYFGGLTFIFLNTALAVTGIWAALGLRSGIWADSFLLMIFIITFFFAVLYAVSTLFAVLARSAIVAILITCGAWFVFFIVGALNQFFEARQRMEETRNLPAEKRWGDGTFATVVRVVHKVTPRTSDLNQLAHRILLSDFLTGDLRRAPELQPTANTWGESFAVSGIFLALVLGLACWWFATRDY